MITYISTKHYNWLHSKVYNLMSESQTLSEENPPELEINGEFIFFQGKEVIYPKQIIRQQNFFLVDSGIELPLSQEILNFDQKYFWYMLNKKIIRELQLLDPAVAAQILGAISDLPEKSYVAIFSRLSLHKIKKLVMNNQFYLLLIKRLSSFHSQKKQTLYQYDQLPSFLLLYELDEPHKRVLYVLDYVKFSVLLNEVFYLIAYQITLSMLNQQNFLETLTMGNEQHWLINSEQSKDKQRCFRDFLKNALKMIHTLYSMTRSPQEILPEHQLKNERVLIQLVLSDSFIEIITVNFEYFLNFDGKNLTRMLAIIAVQKQQKLWDAIISKKYAKEKKSFIKKQPLLKNTSQKDDGNAGLHFEETNNENLFIQLMTNNFYEIGQPQWEISEGIIADLIKYNASAAKFCLIKLFSQLSNHFTTVSVIELIIKFIKKVCSPPEFDRVQIQFFLIEFVGSINVAVSDQYRKIDKLIKDRRKQKVDFKLVYSMLKVYNLILELKLVSILYGLHVVRAISQLMELTRNKKGIIQGVRRAFFKTKTVYLVETHLLQKVAKPKQTMKAASSSLAIQKSRSKMQELGVFLTRID